VYSITGETAIFTAPKGHLVAKNAFALSFRPTRKDQQEGGQYANASCYDQHKTTWDSFKK